MKNIFQKITLVLVISCISTSAYSDSQSIKITDVNTATVVNESATSASQLSPKSLFFKSAEISATWWQEWGELDSKAYYSTQLAHSELIKNILETDYRVIVPFELPHGYDPEYMSNCAKLTPRLLSEVFAVTTHIVAPELTYPRYKTYPQRAIDQIIENSSERNPARLKENLNLLHQFCQTDESRKFVLALDGFLDEYKQVIVRKYTIEIDAKKKEDERHNALIMEQKNAADEAIQRANAKALFEMKRKEDAEKIIAKRQAAKLALIEAEKEEERKRQQESIRLANEQQRIAREKYISDLKAGKLPIKSLSDATIFYNPEAGNRVIAQPPINADNQFYKATGKLVRNEGNQLIVEVQLYNDMKYFKVVPNKNTKYEEGFTPKFDGRITIVGKNIATFSYTTVAGIKRYGPVFDAVMLGEGSNY